MKKRGTGNGSVFAGGALHRRDFLRLSAGALGTLALGPALGSVLSRRAWAGPASEPHFFLQVMIPSGFDASYLFDARPLAMSSAATPLLQNYLGKEPTLWTGENGQSTWATELATRLAPHRKRFSVINGVVMSNTFDGHGQCINILFNGSAEAGESFIPVLNRRGSLSERSLDAIQMGKFAHQSTNAERTLPLTPELALKLQGKLATSGGPVTDPKNPMYSFLRSRYEAIAQGAGLFSGGAAQLLDSTLVAPELIGKFRQMKLPAVPPAGTPGFVAVQDYERFPALVAEIFKGGIARSAVMTVTEAYPFTYDVHDPAAAKDMPARAGALADLLASLLKGLTETAFDGTRSLLDVTTVLIASEFTRSMRQGGKPIDATGTDHNTFANSMLIAGKGIRGGCVFGESDFRTATETLSGAHLKADPRQVKFVGRPFDFAKSEARQDLPTTFAMDDYLTCASVINTLYSLFGVPESQHRLVERFGKKAPIVPGLLA